jgi:hypothetical protein
MIPRTSHQAVFYLAKTLADILERITAECTFASPPMFLVSGFGFSGKYVFQDDFSGLFY